MNDLDLIKPLIRRNSTQWGEWLWFCVGQMAWGFGYSPSEAYREWFNVIANREENDKRNAH